MIDFSQKIAEQKSEEFAGLLQSMIRNESDYDTKSGGSKDLA